MSTSEHENDKHGRSSSGRLGVVVVAMAMALGLAGVACAGQQDMVATEGESNPVAEELPEWLVDVYPGPGKSMASVSVVEVVHRVRGPRRGIRLVIDGVDVTAKSKLSPGRLQYNPRQGALAPLDSGLHTIVVKRVRRPGFGERPDVTDRFEWTVAVR